ncbi:MAG: phosphatase PAP2 family protein [Panacagrimonas sp.]
MRTRTIAVAVAAAVLTLSHAAPAQSVGRILERDFKSAVKDIEAVWGSPFDGNARDWWIAAGGFAAFGVSMFADQAVSDWAIENDSSAFFRALRPVRRGGLLFSGKTVVPPVAAAYVVGIVAKNEDVRDFVIGCMTSWASQSMARKGIAGVFGRARPDTMPSDPQHWEIGGGFGNWEMRSFPAGHFANAMACATYWNKRFRMGPVEPALYALAAAVGIGRFADRAHWLSDTVIGGLLGYAVGSEVARRRLEERAERQPGTAGLNVAPEPGALNFSFSFRF